MICDYCAVAADQQAAHDGCPGDTWCDCQHLPSNPYDIKENS